MSKYNKRNWIVLFLSAVLMFVSVAQATAMTMPEARIWGRADDGWNTFDANIQYSATNSLSYAYNGGLAGYANHVSGGNTQSLGASAYATTDGITPNVNNGAIAVPYLYFQWRVVRNDGGSGNPLDMAPVDLSIVYGVHGSTAGVGSVSSDAFFNAGNVFGNLWFAPVATPSYPYTPGSYAFHDDAYINSWNTVYMQLSAHAQSGNTGGVGEIDALFTAALSLPSAVGSTYHIELNTVESPDPAPVPEPSTIFLFGAGLGGLAVWRRRATKK